MGSLDHPHHGHNGWAEPKSFLQAQLKESHVLDLMKGRGGEEEGEEGRGGEGRRREGGEEGRRGGGGEEEGRRRGGGGEEAGSMGRVRSLYDMYTLLHNTY